MLTHRQLRAKALGRAGVKAQFNELDGEYALLDEFLKARAEQGPTQAQVGIAAAPAKKASASGEWKEF